MHYSHFVPALLAVALAAPAPAPQEIDFKKVDALLPEMTRTVPVTAKPTIISFDPTAAIESIGDATPTLLHPKNKREGPWDNSGCSACPAQPTIANYYNAVVDSDTAFLADSAISGKASQAVTPAGYSKVYTNLKASANGYVYMGYTVPPSYDPAFCSEKCDSMAGCASFNLFFERNPAVDACSDTCQDPPAFANIKCTFWGGAITPGAARNDGQWRNRFHVVIAGSNGYVKNGLPATPGYSTVQTLGAVSINAPRDCNGVDTYMGYKLFTNTPFDIRLCAAACDAETAYNLEHGNPRLCNFWNTYLLDRNGESQGQYCSLYTEAWDNSFATNDGQWRDNDHYTISSSYSSYNLTSPGFPVCPADIAYLNSEGAAFCTSFNSYVAPHTLQSVVGTTSETSTVHTTQTVVSITRTYTQLVTVTAAAPNKRDATTSDDIAIETFKVIFPDKNTANTSATVTIHVTDELAKRTVLATPTSIADWQSTRIAAACSSVATGTITDLTTTSIFTSYIATVTDVSTDVEFSVTYTTATTTVPAVQLSSPTVIVGSLSGASRFVDDEYFGLVLPFSIGAFGSYSPNVFVSSNGVVSINSGSPQFDNEYYAFPTSGLADVSILGLFDDLVINPGTQQGIYYQIDGAVGSRSVTFEMYMSAYGRSSEYYHFSMTFYENQPGVSLFKYFQVSLSGASASVGAQRLSTGQFLKFSHDQPVIHPGLFVRLDTVAGTMSSGNF